MRNIEIVELLLDKGAKVSAVDKVNSIYLFTLVFLIILVLQQNLHLFYNTFEKQCREWLSLMFGFD